MLLLVARCDDFIIRGGVVKRQRLGVSQPSTEATYDCDPCGEGRNTLSRAHWHNKGRHPITIGWIDGVWLSLPYRDKVCRDDVWKVWSSWSSSNATE